MDIAQNSVAAEARWIAITLSGSGQMLEFSLSDNGRGMDSQFLESVTDPFTTTRKTRTVGLGLPLLKQSAELAQGVLAIQSEPNKGTTVHASFIINHIDRIPVGDFPGVIALLIAANPQIEWIVEFKSRNNRFHLNTKDIKSALKEVPIENQNVLSWIQNTLTEAMASVFGGVLNEVS